MSGQRADVFALRLRPGCEAEYKRRHDAIWPELTQLFADHGISRYEIHLHRETGLLFAFRLVDEGADLASMLEHPVMARWRKTMADLLVQHGDRPVREDLVPMYRFEPERGR